MSEHRRLTLRATRADHPLTSLPRRLFHFSRAPPVGQLRRLAQPESDRLAVLAFVLSLNWLRVAPDAFWGLWSFGPRPHCLLARAFRQPPEVLNQAQAIAMALHHGNCCPPVELPPQSADSRTAIPTRHHATRALRAARGFLGDVVFNPHSLFPILRSRPAQRTTFPCALPIVNGARLRQPFRSARGASKMAAGGTVKVAACPSGL